MNLCIKNHSKIYQVVSVSQIFFPYSKINITDDIPCEGITIFSEMYESSNKSALYIDGKLIDQLICDNDEEIGYSVKNTTFKLLNKYTNKNPKWGMLTGIRPTKIIRKLLNEGYTDTEIIEKIKNKYYASNEKIELSLDVCKKEMNILSKSSKGSVSLYIGIPFCPTKCDYCSFTSFSINKYSEKNIVSKYVDYLLKELKWVKDNIKSKIDTIYIGGGTPTSLDEENLYRLLSGIKNIVNLEYIREYTVEAGRPDTITLEKLKILKDFSVSRISINPQTMHDETLKKVGRGHSVHDFVEKFNLAKNIGFDNINVDLILGLPDENLNDVQKTIDEVVKLEPSNVTIHTLAIKRGSNFKNKLKEINMTETDICDDMLKIAYNGLKKSGYEPYYMYRQKNIVGNYENVGYSKSGFEGIYNVEIIEEEQSIIAIGVGAVSKVVDYKTGKLERIFNFKNIEEYFNRFDEQLDRKKLFKEMGI